MDTGSLIIIAGVSLFCVVAATLAHHTFSAVLRNSYRRGVVHCMRRVIRRNAEFKNHDFL